MPITINGLTGISGVDGSNNAPALRGTDTDTGIFFGSDTIDLTVGGLSRMKIDSSGRIVQPYQIGFGLYQSGARSSAGDFVNYSNLLGVETNTANCFNTTTGVFTAPVAGVYLFGMSLKRESDNTGRDILQLRYNNIPNVYESIEVYGNYQDVGNALILKMNTNDNVRCYYSPVIGTQCRATFSGWLLG